LHQVRRDDFLAVIKMIRKSITPEMIQFFEEWRDQSGGRSA
jgi:SpoVK/Ycf46/Vps4 family AAA+-type ATPase